MRTTSTQRHMTRQIHAAPLPSSRRQVLMTMLAGLLAGAGIRGARAEQLAAGGETAPKTITLFTLRGAGDRDGRDWQNAMPLKSLSRALGRAQPGSGFFIGFDPLRDEPAATDAEQIRLAVSGRPDAPIHLGAGLISGQDAVAVPAYGEGPTLFKDTDGWSLADFGKRGGSACYLAVGGGASHLRLSGFRVDGTPADGFVKFRAKKDRPETFTDIVISNIDATNVGRIVESARGASLSNLLIEDCRAVGIVRGFARFRHLTHAVLRRLELDADNMDAGGSNVCQLIALASGEDVLFEDIVLRNAVNDPRNHGKKEGYVQGDGIVCERATRAVTIRRCHGSGMGDAAFDIKATDAVIEDSSTRTCKYGARVWSESNNIVRRCDFRDPRSPGGIKGACIQVAGRLEIVDTRLQTSPGTVAIKLHKLKNGNDPVVHMRGGSIEVGDDARLAAAEGPGVLELHQVAVNGVVKDHRYVFDKDGK